MTCLGIFDVSRLVLACQNVDEATVLGLRVKALICLGIFDVSRLALACQHVDEATVLGP